jgi:hypothetical protein
MILYINGLHESTFVTNSLTLFRRAMADSDKRLLSDLDQTTSLSTGAAQSSSNWSYASSVATETKAAAKEPLIDYFDMMPL